jgi:hypothetical protein
LSHAIQKEAVLRWYNGTGGGYKMKKKLPFKIPAEGREISN